MVVHDIIKPDCMTSPELKAIGQVDFLARCLREKVFHLFPWWGFFFFFLRETHTHPKNTQKLYCYSGGENYIFEATTKLFVLALTFF